MGPQEERKSTMILDAIYEFSLAEMAPPRTDEYEEALSRFRQAVDTLKQGLTSEQKEQLEAVLSSKNVLVSLEDAEQFKLAFSAGVQLERETREAFKKIDCE